nr:ganglioside GM2 activator-like [Paramormyrops kingsleyae]
MAALKCLSLPLVICALGIYVQLNSAQQTEMPLAREPGISTWTNCGSSDILNITSFSIPSQITIPGSINVSFLGELKVPVSAPLKIAVLLRRKVFGLWVWLPCLNGYGSCTYKNICEDINEIGEEGGCPLLISLAGGSCVCPIQPVVLHLPPTVLNISDVEVPSFLANGEYEVQITVSSGTQEIACLRTSFHLKLQ